MAQWLRIPLHEADFVAQYWTRVFAEFVDLTSRGLTPNPDLGVLLPPDTCLIERLYCFPSPWLHCVHSDDCK